MPLDPNIALQVGQPVQPLDPMKAYGQVLTLKHLVDQQQLGGLQMAQAQRAADKEIRLADLARSADGDEAKFLSGYRRVDPLGAIDLGIKTRKAGFEQAKMEREAKKAEYEMLLKQNEIVGQELGALPENPTYEQALMVSRRLNARGVQHDEKEIPQDPAALVDYIRQRRAANLTAQQQLAELAPKSTLGKLLEDQRREQARTVALSQSSVSGEPSIGPDGSIVAPTVNISAPPDPYAAAVARETYGPADAPFRYGPTGKVEGVPEVQNFQRTKAREGATNINVQNNAVPLGKAAETKVDEGLLDTSATLMRLNGIRKQYKPEWSEFSTQAGMKLNQLGEKYLGVNIAPAAKEKFRQYTQWRQKAKNNINLTIQSLTGAAMSDTESKRIMATLPSDEDSATEFQAKLDGAEEQTKMALARLTYIKRRGGMSITDVPLEAMPEVMRARDREIEGEVLRRYPNMDPAERNDLIKRQLAQEFGLIGK